MKTVRHVSFFALAILTGCNTTSDFALVHGDQKPQGVAFSPLRPIVIVKQSAGLEPIVIVNQEPIFLTQKDLSGHTETYDGKAGIPIIWEIPSDQPWFFDKTNGITLQQPFNIAKLLKPDLHATEAEKLEIRRLIEYAKFDGPENEVYACHPVDQGDYPRKFKCLASSNSNKPYKRIKYTITLRNASGDKLTLDPIIGK